MLRWISRKLTRTAPEPQPTAIATVTDNTAKRTSRTVKLTSWTDRQAKRNDGTRKALNLLPESTVQAKSSFHLPSPTAYMEKKEQYKNVEQAAWNGGYEAVMSGEILGREITEVEDEESGGSVIGMTDALAMKPSSSKVAPAQVGVTLSPDGKLIPGYATGSPSRHRRTKAVSIDRSTLSGNVSPIAPSKNITRISLGKKVLRFAIDEQPTAKFDFLSLPLKARNKVYELLLKTDHTILVCDCIICNNPTQPAITRTNRQVRSETLPVYLGENKFRLQEPFLLETTTPKWISSMSRTSVTMLAHVEMGTMAVMEALSTMGAAGMEWVAGASGPEGGEGSLVWLVFKGAALGEVEGEGGAEEEGVDRRFSAPTIKTAEIGRVVRPYLNLNL